MWRFLIAVNDKMNFLAGFWYIICFKVINRYNSVAKSISFEIKQINTPVLNADSAF